MKNELEDIEMTILIYNWLNGKSYFGNWELTIDNHVI